MEMERKSDRKRGEIKKFKYLGYVLKQNGSQEVQIKDKVKRAAMVMRPV